MMMSNHGVSTRNGASNLATAVGIVPAILIFAIGCCGCTSSNLDLLKLAWKKRGQPVGTRPSPYAPVPIGPPSPPTPQNPTEYGQSVDRVVASVDGNPITNFDIHNPGAGAANAAAGNNPAAMDPDTTLKQLIAQQLLDQEAQKYADRVDDSEVDRFIQQIEDQNHLTDTQLRAQLQAEGTSYEAFRKRAFTQVETMEMVQREVRAKIHVPDSAIETYYKDHPDEFTVNQEKYRLAQILITVPNGAPPDKVAAAQKKAAEVRALALKGTDFGELARQYSEDDSKNKGGELGEFNPADLNDQIAAAVKQTKAGDVAPLVHTRYGFHIIKVEEHQQAGVQPLTAVRDQIHDKLVTEQAKDKFEQWVDQDLAKRHDIETLN
ncbi:MAG: peptidylprolyl isomerase [Deltaproteobacteria bacterium]|nr:peptidylprolyl isomerase [Deltaproteobacteria bacterium]